METSGSSVYREEADVRKAKRREELALKEQESKAAASEEIISEEASLEEISKTYVIRPGDTIYQISMDNYGSMAAMEEICRLNGISLEEIIYPGQIIVLP